MSDFYSYLPEFTNVEWIAVFAVFVWSGFVRSGLGFGGAILALPLLLIVDTRLTLWLPVIGIHLLLFSFYTLCTTIHNVDWRYFFRSAKWILPAKIVGIMGLLNLPITVLVVIAYSLTTFYGVCWVMGVKFRANNVWQNRSMLTLGGYLSGTMLGGAPLMVPVFVSQVSFQQLRATLFAVWFVLVVFKLVSFVALDVPLQWHLALALLPAAVIGQWLGLQLHKKLATDERLTQKALGYGLLVVSCIGFIKALL